MKSGFAVSIGRVKASHNSRDVIRRLSVEGKIAGKLVSALLDAGFELSVNDGEEIILSRSRGKRTILAAMASTDDDFLLVYRPGEAGRVGWVRLVYGNDGWDVISDYSLSLESVIAPVNAYAEGFVA